MRLGGLGFRVRARDGVRLGMYDISLSYMMYQPVSHSIPLTIILHSAFCVLQNTPAGHCLLHKEMAIYRVTWPDKTCCLMYSFHTHED